MWVADWSILESSAPTALTGALTTGLASDNHWIQIGLLSHILISGGAGMLKRGRYRDPDRRSTEIKIAVSLFLGAALFVCDPVSAGAAETKYQVPPYIKGDLAYHHHPVLRFVLYDPEAKPGPVPKFVGMITPPANIGIERTSEKRKFREIHIHESISGRLHTESVDPLKKYRLGDFFALWAKSDPKILELIKRAQREGTVYLFDHNRTRGTYYTTRMKDSSKLSDLALDDGRHIVIYLPERKKKDSAATTTSTPLQREMQNQ